MLQTISPWVAPTFHVQAKSVQGVKKAVKPVTEAVHGVVREYERMADKHRTSAQKTAR